MTDVLTWLSKDVPHAKMTPPITDGHVVAFGLRADGSYGPTPRQFSEEEAASLRAELAVPPGWILETLWYDLSHTVNVTTARKLEGYHVAVHGVRVLARTVVPHPSGKPSQIYTLNGGELVVPPGGTVPLYACLTGVAPDGSLFAAVGAPGPDSPLWKDGNQPLLRYLLLILSTRIHYQGSNVFAERRSHPDFIYTLESIGGLEASKDRKEINRACQDFTLMDDLGKLWSRPRARRTREDDLNQAVRIARSLRSGTPPQHPTIELIAEAISNEEERPLTESGLNARWQGHKKYGEESITLGEVMSVALSAKSV